MPQEWCQKKGYGDAARLLDRIGPRMVSFYSFPKEHWRHLRTSNVVESPFAAVRPRTTAAKRYKKVENATAVAEGAVYVNGVLVQTTHKEDAA